MSKIRYTCAEWGDADGLNTGICRDFMPSTRDPGQSEEAYREFQRECAESAREGTDFYRRRNCKRSAHMMLPYGRSGVRYGPPPVPRSPESGEPYVERLERVQTPLRRRTQSSRWKLLVAKQTQDRGRDLNPRLTAQVAKILADASEDSGLLSGAAFSGRVEPQLRELAEFTALDLERVAKLKSRANDNRKAPLYFRDSRARKGQVPEGLMVRLARSLSEFNRRFTHAVAGSNVKSAKLSVAPDPEYLRLVVRVDDKKYQIPGLDTRQMRVVAMNGLEEPFVLLKARSQDPNVVQARRGSRAERRIPYSGALLLFLVQTATQAAQLDPRGRVAITVEDAKGKRHTFPSVSLRGLQHSDVLQRYDPGRKSYYTFRNLTQKEAAEYLLGLKPPPPRKRRKRRGRMLKPLTARENPVARPSFINIDEYRDLAPGTYRPIPSRPTYCVYRKVVKGSAPAEEEFRVTTCRRAQSWQAIRPEKQFARLAEEQQAETTLANPRRAPMGRRKNFDPLAELMAEFGPTARLGKRQKKGAPNFDRRIAHPKHPGVGRHYDPYAQTVAPYPARTSLPTNRRNPRRAMTPAQAEFAENARQAAALMRNNGMSRKQAWNVVRNNPDKTQYFRQTGYHTEGPFLPDFDSPYEQRRGAYDARGPATPPTNRRNPSTKSMGGAQLEALANSGDWLAATELRRRQKRRAERAKARQSEPRKPQRRSRDFYKP